MGDTLQACRAVSATNAVASAAAAAAARFAVGVANKAICCHAGPGDAVIVLIEAESQGQIIADFQELGEVITASRDVVNVKLKTGGSIEASRMDLRAPAHTRAQLVRIGISQIQSNPYANNVLKRTA